MLTKNPTRNRELAAHLKDAYGEGGDTLKEAINGLLGINDNEVMLIAGAAYIQSCLELACSLWTEDAKPFRRECAERHLNLARWMIKRWGTDGGEIISRIGIVGLVLEEHTGDKFALSMKKASAKGLAAFSLQELFTEAIPNARAVVAGTYKNELG